MNDLSTLFPQFEKALLAELLDSAEVKLVKAGDVLMRKGQYIKYTMIVVRGSVKVYRQDSEGGEFFMYNLKPLQACAISMACVANLEKSEVTAVAAEDSEILMIPIRMMEQWMGKYRSWYEFVVHTYRDRFEEVLQTVDQIAFRSMDERLEFYLKRQSKEGMLRVINLSHQQIATDLNSTREVISRLLKKMEQRGLIKLGRNTITLDAKMLEV
jgi:CRP/FNR family transcriptional regulator